MNCRLISFSVAFGVLALDLTLILFAWIVDRTAWHPYWTWVAALSGTTFVMYGLDKFISLHEENRHRTPEIVLHGLSLAGGFLGGWLGRTVFHHKTNVGRKPWFLIVLVASTVGHGLLIHALFFQGG